MPSDNRPRSTCLRCNGDLVFIARYGWVHAKRKFRFHHASPIARKATGQPGEFDR